MIKSFLAILLVCVFTFGCVQTSKESNSELIGGQRDEHGCLGPAGYSWNEYVGACLREWELDEQQKEAAKTAIAPISYPVTVIKVDREECEGCFTVYLQREDNGHQMNITLRDWKFAQDKEASLTKEEAIEIAGESDCIKEGQLTNDIFYNENSRTWWIDIESDKEGCNPACVVSEETNTAEINWRCTGLILPESTDINNFEDCVNAGYPIMKSNPRQCRTPDGENFIEDI